MSELSKDLTSHAKGVSHIDIGWLPSEKKNKQYDFSSAETLQYLIKAIHSSWYKVYRDVRKRDVHAIRPVEG